MFLLCWLFSLYFLKIEKDEKDPRKHVQEGDRLEGILEGLLSTLTDENMFPIEGMGSTFGCFALNVEIQ